MPHDRAQRDPGNGDAGQEGQGSKATPRAVSLGVGACMEAEKWRRKGPGALGLSTGGGQGPTASPSGRAEGWRVEQRSNRHPLKAALAKRKDGPAGRKKQRASP